MPIEASECLEYWGIADFFIEKDETGQVIDCTAATKGHLKIVPEGISKKNLALGYAAMLADDWRSVKF